MTTTTAAPAINQALRAHVTSTRFALTLGASHIAALIRIDYLLRRDKSLNEELDDKFAEYRRLYGYEGPHQRAFANSGVGSRGLQDRGLLVHTPPTDHDTKPADIWTITPAGRHVIGLLRECGLWAEFGGTEEADAS